MYDLSDLPNKVTYCNWRTGMMFNPLRLLNVLKRIQIKSRSYYRTFPNVPENTTRHTVFSNLLRNPAHAHSIASIVIFHNRIKQLLKVVKNIDF